MPLLLTVAHAAAASRARQGADIGQQLKNVVKRDAGGAFTGAWAGALVAGVDGAVAGAIVGGGGSSMVAALEWAIGELYRYYRYYK